MKKPFRIPVFFLFVFYPLSAIVGDWISYGSQLTLRDLYLEGTTLRAASRGGFVEFDLLHEQFVPVTADEQAAHIDLNRFYVNSDASEWYSYQSGAKGISSVTAEGRVSYYDLNFNTVSAFTGNDQHVFAVYKKDFTPGVVHFVKYFDRYIFQDLYDQFPGSPAELYDIALVGDSIYIAADGGIYRAWLNNSNLKPASAWTAVDMDSSRGVIRLAAQNDTLYYVSSDHVLYARSPDGNTKLLEPGEAPVGFMYRNGSLYFGTQSAVYDLNKKLEIYRSNEVLSGFLVNGNSLWLAREGKGLLRTPLSGGDSTEFIPNTMMQLQANALAIDAERKLYVTGINGVAVLNERHWHNYVFSPYRESFQETVPAEAFSADTLNISYIIGGQTAVYDALISSSGELYFSLTDISAITLSGQNPEAQGPGALVRMNLNDPREYTVYDTTGGIIVGTQELGGSPWYLKVRGLEEDRFGNIWVLNVHTLDAKPLIRFGKDGSIRKYSVEESNGTLQVLAREMVFDNAGRLWIANEARQADIPRTTGGVTVYDPQSGIWRLITTADGLISNDVNSIAMDPLTGSIWVATAAGVQMIRNPGTLSAGTIFSLNPPLDGLSGMLAKKIRIDPKGNKWILTQSQGVQIFLSNNTWFNEGKGLRRSNSGLLDDVVYDLVFDTREGYAYLLTASGLNRYESPWTESRSSMSDLRIFPQPFRPGLDSRIVVDGLAEQTQVSISTLDGRVLITFAPNSPEHYGKQIIWDGKLPGGNPIPRGVYMIFARNINGLRVSAKFAVE
ncbi:MAG: hypothetical protein PHX07_00085 [Candidatus Marinimicrobia bacterium]|jgi:streptogramin lyase|nr:hypothetical protein [Candidatus Neomarinimicrobiota bacterium]MDD4960618.1 hypothetical protein [Candidatus Neomarinimicrobiota bacterium]MDD5709600.1 hypothetical protein [Candidatus Neomarinimicrobiota bacterium]MDX9777460.1 hypothetical protein [bacterium]